MRRKDIEKIPYITIRSTGSTPFVAVTKQEEIAGISHLFLEVYKREQPQVPVLRAVYTQEDWELYYPEEKRWSSAHLHDECERLRWEVGIHRNGKLTAISKKNTTRIEEFVKKERGYWNRWTKWDGVLEILEGRIIGMRNARRDEKREAAFKERCAAMPELPEGLEAWSRNTLFNGKAIIAYKRKGQKATFTCTECGCSWTSYTGQPETFEEYARKWVPVPTDGAWKQCKCCGATGTLKPIGRLKNEYSVEKRCYVGQKYGQKGVVIRYLSVEKITQLEVPCRYVTTEIARNFFVPDKKRVQKDYHLYPHWSGKNAWRPHNIGGLNNITQEKAKIYPETYRELKDTILQYSGIQYYREPVKLAKYMEAYRKHPCLEMLVKMNLTEIADRLIDEYTTNLHENAKSPEKLLGIRKEHMKLLTKRKGSIILWNILKMECDEGYRWKDEECRILEEIRPDIDKLKLALEFMTLRKFLNRVEKYAGCQMDEYCSRTIARFRHITTTYLDYLEMRSRRGYDLNNGVYAYPKNLDEANRKMILEINKEEIDRRIKVVEENFPDIRKHYLKLKKKYAWESDEMFIRPAKSAGEIALEGRTLHHCVGGDGYLGKHNRGDSTILFLRFKDEPETPYITVEIEENHIKQWYGAYDRKPDEENVKKWLDAYLEHLESPEVQEKAAV